MARYRTQRVNGFIVRTGTRRPRRIRDYKVRKGPYKTKTGQIWHPKKGYWGKGSYKGKRFGKKIGWRKYKRKL